jgi:hypothetical protein
MHFSTRWDEDLDPHGCIYKIWIQSAFPDIKKIKSSLKDDRSIGNTKKILYSSKASYPLREHVKVL